MVEELMLAVSDFAPCTGSSDEWRWTATTDGLFTTKSAYDLLAVIKGEQQIQPLELAKVWEAPTPHKAKVTAWRCLRNRLATCDNLLRRNIQLGIEERWCNACVSCEETAEHLFLHCPKAEAVGDQIQQWLNIKTAKPRGILQHFISFISERKGKKGRRLLLALWVGTIGMLWKSINESRFQSKISKSFEMFKNTLWSWSLNAQPSLHSIPDIFDFWAANEGFLLIAASIAQIFHFSNRDVSSP
ncbi:uncharacterized protein LOC131026121 [Salvia miltiorrhiza]|uniref:uncharacterized protein LOC131026121 n=1 Tax=Salvia miltiorrhiza TaxID=226208 RepID=UPI0025AB8529|nr:uncharacterized protein LOC131026121 [Salvia miltiorrhiza]